MESIVDKDGKIYQFEKHYIEIALKEKIEKDKKFVENVKEQIEKADGIVKESLEGSVPILNNVIHDFVIVLARVQSMEVHK